MIEIGRKELPGPGGVPSVLKPSLGRKRAMDMCLVSGRALFVESSSPPPLNFSSCCLQVITSLGYSAPLGLHGRHYAGRFVFILAAAGDAHDSCKGASLTSKEFWIFMV